MDCSKDIQQLSFHHDKLFGLEMEGGYYGHMDYNDIIPALDMI
jgi:hypothetical protein